MIRFSILASMLLAACSAPGDASPTKTSNSYETVLEAPPYTPITRLGPEPYTPTVHDRRWQFADRLEHQHLPMLRRLKAGEIGNFGGIEWRWADGPQSGGLGTVTGIVYFVNKPTSSLRRYTDNTLFQPARGDFARTDQDRVARDWAERIGQDIASPGFGNMDAPWLDIRISRNAFEAMRDERGWDVPTNLILKVSHWAEPDLPAVPDSLKASIRYLPAETVLAGPTPDIATYDAIVLRDGCFFIDEDGEDDPLAMFPLGIGIYRDDEGHLAFRSRHSGQTTRLARVGSRMQLGSRSEVSDPPDALIAACGQHRVVTVNSLNQAAGYGGVWHAVKENAARDGLNEAEAMAQANACLLEQEKLLADNRLRGGNAELTWCEMIMHIPPTPPTLPGTG